jgi:hypothetical protein
LAAYIPDHRHLILRVRAIRRAIASVPYGTTGGGEVRV